MLWQTNTNNGEEELIPNADKKDLGLYALSHIHTSKWDVLLGLRTDTRKVETESFEEDYNSFTSSVGFKEILEKTKSLDLIFQMDLELQIYPNCFLTSVHHGTSRYEVGDKNLSERRIYKQTSLLVHLALIIALE